MMANLGAISLGVKQPSTVFREVLERCTTYACAYDELHDGYMVSPSYITLVGIKDNEGVVISRNRTDTIDVAHVSDEDWYLVQTNDDHYLGECNSRCREAKKNFENLGRSRLTPSLAFDRVLDQAPNVNTLSVYASVMVPSAGLFLTELVTGTVIADDL